MVTEATTSPETSAARPASTETPTIVHYEIPATDAPKLAAFYRGVFGWQFGSAPGMETYQMASTGSGNLGIAIFPRESEAKPVNYVGVDSVKAFAKKITAAGGQVLHEFTVTGMGYGAVTLDPEGNPVGLWQQDPNATEG